jgi:lipopolysaccharide/colanic/teichoic acid biosynthesis glycosyltransferase
MLKIRLNLVIKMGVSAFPDDALIYGDLIDMALLHPCGFDPEMSAVPAPAPKIKPPTTPPPGDIRRTTQPLPPLDETSPDWRTRVNALLRGPQILPSNGMLLIQTVHAPKVSDPDFWVNRFPYQGSAARLFYTQIKRILDIGLILITLLFVLPAALLVMLAILLDTGRPIFFVQPRTGLGGRRFKMIKFRTMVTNAEEKLRELAEQGLAKLDAEGKLAEPLKLDRDPRVTRVGRILRKTSLDELPQLINVLMGDMSLVGPRPTSWNVDSYTLMQTERLSVRPGITGLWQVCSRGTTDFDTWLQWDVRYIEKMSFALDLQILFRTIFKVISRSGAH